MAELIRELAVVHGRVTLSPGRGADYYIDLRCATLCHESSHLIDSLLRELTAGWDYTYVSDLTPGADPVATPAMYVEGHPIDTSAMRKEAKKHGMRHRVEGSDIVSKKVLVVEGTTTTGNSPPTAVTALREADAEVVGVATVVDRMTGADEVIKVEGPEYRYLLGLDDSGLA